jgi:hypothetical protein
MKLGGLVQDVKFSAIARRRPEFCGGIKFKGHWDIVCKGPDGHVKWVDKIENLIVDAGLNHALDATLSAGSQITTWYIGITNGSPSPAAGDTMASHAGWVENQNYDEANRVTWVDGGVAGKSVDNSASKATFTIDTAAQTIGGAFLVSENTKGGTSGTLYAAGAFTGGNKSADDNDVIEVTATFTSADDGV